MAHSVTDDDLRTMLDLIEKARAECPPVGLPAAALELVQTLVGCDVVVFVDFEPLKRRACVDQEACGDTVVFNDPAPPAADPFWTHYWDCPPCSYPSTSGDDRSIITVSDFYSQRQWHETGMYRECVPEVEHEAIMCLSGPPEHSPRVLLARTGTRDFDDHDRLLLTLLRPHVNEVYQDLQARRSEPPALTAQQRRILALVADGLTNKEIARELVLSPATVRTHLENIFSTLSVTTRAAAVATAFRRPPYS